VLWCSKLSPELYFVSTKCQKGCMVYVWVCCRPLASTAGLNPTGDMRVRCVNIVFCQVKVSVMG